MVITGATGAVAFTGNVSITGNLSVTGNYDTAATTTSTYTDTFIKVNTSNAEADAGLIVETSDTDDARMFYDVSENFWSAGHGASYSQVIRIADAVADGNASKEKVLKTTAAGLVTVTNINLAAVGSAISTGDTSSVAVPTIGQVATFGNLWGGATKTVSTGDPSGGSDGDIHFKYVN